MTVLGENEQEFITVYPLDKTAGDSGFFPCGRKENIVEAKSFQFPESIKSDHGVIQVTWKNSAGNSYSCSDVKFNIKEVCASKGYSYMALIGAVLIGLIGLAIIYSKIKSKKPEEIESKGILKSQEGGEEYKEIPLPGSDESEVIIEKSHKRPPRSINQIEEIGNIEEEIKAAAEDKKPSTRPILLAILQKVLLDSIKKVVTSDQIEKVKDYVETKSNGKAVWLKTHFIFAIDCSGSMRGVRWDSVIAGLESFLWNISNMKDIAVTAFTFDTKVNPFCKERSVETAINNLKEIPFTGKGTNYRRAMDYAIEIISRSEKKDYLSCIMFLSDGLGGYPDESMEKLIKMKEEGQKLIFYTIACVTDEEDEMIQMSTDMGGEHYKVVNAEASRLVFSTILNV